MEQTAAVVEAIEKDLVRKGFRFLAKTRCQVCKVEIQWWKSSKGKLIPLTGATLEPHWKTCKFAFRDRPPVRGIRGVVLRKRREGNW